MKIYRNTDINTRFTEIVNSYISCGYTINLNTMCGSQGEICKVHLLAPDQSHILNIILDSFNSWRAMAEGVKITIKRHENKNYKFSKALDTWATLWNPDGEEIYRESFYELKEKVIYADDEYYDAIKQKKIDRMNKRYELSRLESDAAVLPAEANKIVLSYIQKQPKCKSVRLADIHRVERAVTHSGKIAYDIYVRHNVYRLSI